MAWMTCQARNLFSYITSVVFHMSRQASRMAHLFWSLEGDAMPNVPVHGPASVHGGNLECVFGLSAPLSGRHGAMTT
jgi:hypothetical protein